MQQPTANGCARNGAGAATSCSNGASEANGHDARANGEVGPAAVTMDETNQDIVRLIGQHLKTVGLKYAVFIILCLLTNTHTLFIICHD